MAWKRLNSAVDIYTKPVYKVDRPAMALYALERKSNGKYLGIIREIVKREGDVITPGYLDRSKLFIVESKDRLSWKKVKELGIIGIDKIIQDCNLGDMEFIGLEDPDTFAEKKIIHVYFTMAYKLVNQEGFATFLGHAYGKDLDNLVATKPVLSPDMSNIEKIAGFKEATISPVKHNGKRINLAESGYRVGFGSEGVSTIIAAEARDLGKPWKFLGTVVDPAHMQYEWVKGHVSPVEIFAPDFLNHGKLLVGILNGREKTKEINGRKVFGRFSVGLMLFNPRTGEIPWVSPMPIIDDPDARTITFASDFLRTSKNEGILSCHVDDSFVRAYKINADKLRDFLPGYKGREKRKT